MYFEDFSAFIAMGKHGVYVWSAYGASFVLVLGLIVQLRSRRRAVLADIRRQVRRAESDQAATEQQEDQPS